MSEVVVVSSGKWSFDPVLFPSEFFHTPRFRSALSIEAAHLDVVRHLNRDVLNDLCAPRWAVRWILLELVPRSDMELAP